MYLTRNVALLGLAVCISAAISGCSEAVLDTESHTVTLKLPYLSGCESAIQNTQEVFDRISEKEGVQLRIKTVPFDFAPPSHDELVGYIVLASEGDWRTLSSKTPKEYLQISANGILADCMPNDGFDIALENVGALNAILASTPHRGKTYLKVSDEALRLYFNDGSYSVPGLLGEIPD